MIAVYETIVERVSSDRKSQNQGQITLFDNLLKEDKKLNIVEYPDIPEYTEQQKLKFEKQVLGVYVSGHILDQFRDKMKEFNFNSNMLIPTVVQSEDGEEEMTIYEGLEDGKQVKCGGVLTNVKRMNTKVGNKEMAVVTVEDLYGTFEVLVFPKIENNDRK